MKHKTLWTLMLVAVLVMGVAAAAAFAGTRSSTRVERQSATACSLGAVVGGWGESETGTFIGIGPYAAVVRVTFDALGNVSGTETSNLNGTVLPRSRPLASDSARVPLVTYPHRQCRGQSARAEDREGDRA
jgi:hypothetical protein